jgi:hypothetical protein
VIVALFFRSDKPVIGDLVKEARKAEKTESRREVMSWEAKHSEFYWIFFETRATNSSNLESKSFKWEIYSTFCNRRPDRSSACLLGVDGFVTDEGGKFLH